MKGSPFIPGDFREGAHPKGTIAAIGRPGKWSDVVHSVILVYPRSLLILPGSLTVSMSSVKEER